MVTELHKAGRPIPDSQIYEFVKQSVKDSYDVLYERELHPLFLERFKIWIQESKNNNIIGLNDYNELTYVHGTSQSFDSFYFNHNDKRLVTLRGDFLYHQLCTKNNIPFEFYGDGVLKTGDCMIISVPFSDSGNEPDKLDEILNECDEKEIPVWIDAAYMIMAGGITLDLSHRCIEGVSFSLTKGFYGCERLRIGVRMKRKYTDDGIDVANSMSMVSAIGCYVGYEIINKYSADYIYNTYRSRQQLLCDELGLDVSNSVIFGLGNSSNEKYDIFNRGTDYRRICLSNELGDMALDNPQLNYYDSKFK